ncbi:MAG: sigma-54-dependent Fis family transcriptional regulator [Verrucomicrobia bacterium]|nr:sigma-54-dependent Fis family transcriptional regulator [Verrucomicrobiota bacterium]
MDKLLLIDDEVDMHYSFRRLFAANEIEVSTASSAEEGLRLIPKLKPDLVVMDIRMGGMSGLEGLRRIRVMDARLPVIMMTAYGTTQVAIEAMKLGAYDYVLKPFDVPRLKQVVLAALKAARDMRRVVAFEPLLDQQDYEQGIIGRSEPMQAVFKTIGQLADSDATVLITGESGTGKELVAHAIYQHGRRSQMNFLAVNCAAIPENLLESELFGHEKGAFTGATAQRIGRFEQCNGGTIFLDEIGDMSLPTQTKILRVLQSGTFERVGGNETIRVNVRVIAATNQPLERAVAERRFREDLFYRLNVVRVHLPPLRERAGDIPLLVNYFLQKLAKPQRQPPKSLSPDALAALEAYSWPGNVRELENAIQRAVVMAKGNVVLRENLPPAIATATSVPPAPPAAPPTPTAAAVSEPPPHQAPAGRPQAAPAEVAALVDQLFAWARRDPKNRILPTVERELVVRALRETKGNQLQAAKLLGMTRATLRKRLERFDIKAQIQVG